MGRVVALGKPVLRGMWEVVHYNVIGRMAAWMDAWMVSVGAWTLGALMLAALTSSKQR